MPNVSIVRSAPVTKYGRGPIGALLHIIRAHNRRYVNCSSLAVVARALALVFSFIITDGIITALLARVDNSAAEAVAMPANLAF